MLKTYHKQDGSPHQVHLHGWRKQSVDQRDETYRLKLHPGILGAAAPTSVDLRSICSPVEDQGDLGSCTANMLAGMVEANEIRQYQTGKKALAFSAPVLPTVVVSNIAAASDGSYSYLTTVKPGASPTPAPTPPTPSHTFIDVSRLFQYYATRKVENTVSEDSGATIRDTLKAANKYGVVDEKLWPYDVTKYTTKPAQSIWDAAATHKVTSYHSIADGDLTTMKAMLAAGYLVGFGFSVYSYFMSAQMAKTAILHLPTKSESLEGGHAVALAGYDDATSRVLVRNSWGLGWGLGGYFWMDYAYVQNTKLASDFWVIQSSPI